jgi:undecaprenyl diphosphate synthase
VVQDLEANKWPHHIAIIMDGNGRWAQLKSRLRILGHVKGTRVAKKIITHCADSGLKNLTLYAFSTENWLRPADEVGFLMNLLRRYLKKETENLVKKNIRFSIIGNTQKIPEDVISAIRYAQDRTAKNTGLNLVFAISYGSRAEITETVKKIAQKVQKNEISLDDIDEKLISHHLQTTGTPDPDLIIRTSGEQRLSNFLLWQVAYSEFYFSNKLWPDFTESDMNDAVKVFQSRQRRFGAL